MMFDHLPNLAPDIGEILSQRPSATLPVSGDIIQSENQTDGENPKIVTMKETPEIVMQLKFNGLLKADRDALSDLYFNPAKALKAARSFMWSHPTVHAMYVARFVGAFSDTEQTSGRYDVSFKLKIIGKVDEAECDASIQAILAAFDDWGA